MSEKEISRVLEADKTGAFNMDIVNEILSTRCFDTARAKAHDWLKSVESIRPKNVQKVQKVIDNSRNTNNLALAISNCILAFQGLAVVK